MSSQANSDEAKKNKDTKVGCGCLLFILIVVIAVIRSCTGHSSDSTTTNTSSKVKTNISEPAKPSPSPKLTKEEKSIVLLVDKVGLTKTQATDVFADLNKVGFTDVTEVSPKGDTSAPTKYFDTVCGGYKVELIINNGKTLVVSTGTIKLFAAQQGGVLGNITDYTMSDDEKLQYMNVTIDVVTNSLKSPSTAKFPGQGWTNFYDGWSIGKYKKIVTVSSYVDSQNGFGAIIRTDFDFQINSSTKKVIYMRVGDQVVGKPFNN